MVFNGAYWNKKKSSPLQDKKNLIRSCSNKFRHDREKSQNVAKTDKFECSTSVGAVTMVILPGGNLFWVVAAIVIRG